MPAAALWGGLAGIAFSDEPKALAFFVLVTAYGIIRSIDTVTQERLDAQEKAIQNIWDRLNHRHDD